MPIMTQIEASFCGEGAEQIHEWAKDGSEGIFFARVFRKDYLRVKSANTWEGWGKEFCSPRFGDSFCSSSMDGSTCKVQLLVVGDIPYSVFEKIASDFPNIKASGTYSQELGEYCGSFTIQDGEYLGTPSHESISELEQKALDGDVDAQLEMSFESEYGFDQLMWAKHAALQGCVEAYFQLASLYMGLYWSCNKSEFIDSLARKWMKKIKDAFPDGDVTPLFIAAKHASTRGVLFELINDHIADLNSFDEYGMSILHYVAKNNDKFAVKHLVEDYGMNPNLKDPSKPDGPTPIESAKGNKNVIAYLRAAIKDYKEPENSMPVYTTSSRGPAGGWVFYDKGEYSDGWRYLEVAPADLRVVKGVPVVDSSIEGYSEAPSKYVFGFYRTEEGNLYVNDSIVYNENNCTKMSICSGKENTRKLVDKMGDEAFLEPEGTDKTGDYAARLCLNIVHTYKGVPFDDWFLPSADELKWMDVLRIHGDPELGLTSKTFLSSSEDKFGDVNKVYGVWFRKPKELLWCKRSDPYYVRPVRAF